MSRLTLVIIFMVIYMVAMFFIGLYGRKYSSTNKDAMTAAGQGTLLLVTGSYLGAHLGNGVVVGGAQYGAVYGLGGFWYGAGAAVSYVLFGVVMAKILYRKKCITFPDVFQERYGDKITVSMIAVLNIASEIALVAGQILAGKLLFEYLGLNGFLGALLTAGVVVIYSTMSGLWGVMMTDVIQSVLIFVCCIIGIFWLFSVDGFTVMKASLPASAWNFVPFDLETLILMAGPGALCGLLSGPAWQRTVSCKDEKTAVRAPFLGAIGVLAFAILPVLIGMYGLAVDPAAAPKTILFKVLMEDFPPVLGAIMVCAILAAVMSTCDSSMLSAAANAVNDLYMKVINPGCTDQKKLAKITHAVTASVGIASIAVALSFDMLIPLLNLAYSIINAGALVMVVGALFWKKANKQAAYASFIVGEGTFILYMLGVINPPVADIFPILPSLIAYIVVGLLTQPKNNEASAS